MKRSVNEVKLLAAGEGGLVVEFGEIISPEINLLVHQFTKLLTAKPIEGVLEVVPTYRSVTIYFDPLTINRANLSQYIHETLTAIRPQQLNTVLSRLIHVPVCYGGVLGPDLEYVARYTGLAVGDVIALHTAQPYLVYMLGFTPGFPYLGGLPAKLMVPRLERPRIKVPAGSVGIGGSQTGFYPTESQGEWWLIGRTPLKVFNPDANNPFLVAPGDYVQFVAIEQDEYFFLRKQIAAGAFEPRISYI